ncbi:hypothetical protein [Neoroseomonas lacus]|uniref:Uncharacterized protein n=1 Tax=Neoroseomonas lacus TaxID=287609 RepID=A0A917KX11_9PROT|nr:hypothetical protein [Neoroseomonas lacus]GGJ33801.1 hypothetical protein GCM10011320_46950 [Neoroseomonas lacus]
MIGTAGRMVLFLVGERRHTMALGGFGWATAPSIENLAAALQVIAEHVGMSRAEAETLVRSPRLAAVAERI